MVMYLLHGAAISLISPRCHTGSRVNSKCFPLVPGKKVGADHFLNRLPKAVVKAGHVIDIRNSVRDTLQVRNSYFLVCAAAECTNYLTSASNRVPIAPRATAQ